MNTGSWVPFFLLPLLLIGGCATKQAAHTPEKQESPQRITPLPRAKADRALVYIIRTTSFFGKSVPLNARANGFPVGELQPLNYVHAYLEEGTHQLEVGFNDKLNRRVTVDLKQNRTYYFVTHLEMAPVDVHVVFERITKHSGESLLAEIRG